MQPALSLLGAFSAGARLVHSAGSTAPKMLAFCCRTTSPAEQAIMHLLHMLQRPDDQRWLPFLTDGRWTAERVHAAACAGFQFVGQLVMKVVMPFDCWPLELGKLVHPQISFADKARVKDEFWKLRACCVDPVDGCTFRLRQSLSAKSDIDSGRFLQLVEDVFEMLEPSNIKCEDRFARAKTHSHSNQGAAVFSSKHFLSEWAAMHESSYIAHLSAKYAQCGQSVSSGESGEQSVSRTFMETFSNFVRQKTWGVKNPASLASLGREWKALTAEQQQQYAVRATKSQMANAPAALSTSRAPWSAWGLGSEAWPLSVPDIETLTSSIDMLSKRWKTMHDRVVYAGEELHVPEVAEDSCVALYGMGSCKEDLPNLVKARFAVLFKQVRKLAHLDDLCKGLVHESFLIDRLAVVEIVLDTPLPSPPGFKGFCVYMMVTCMMSPLYPLFLKLESDARGMRALQPGDQCWPEDLSSSLVFENASDISLSLAEQEADNILVRFVNYHFIALTV